MRDSRPAVPEAGRVFEPGRTRGIESAPQGKTVMTLEAMETELASLLDPLDIPGDWTPRQRESYESRRSWLRAKIQDATDALATLNKVEPQMAAKEEWL